MKIKEISIDNETQEKILSKHGIKLQELENALVGGKPKIFRIKDDIYMAIAHHEKYLTIIFEYNKPNVIIKTAYRSSDWQIRWYRRK